MNGLEKMRVYLITDEALARSHGRSSEEVVRAALAAGIGCVQMRAKSLSTREQWALGTTLRTLTQVFGALFIVNDRIDLALSLEADGVHLGEDDLPLDVARRLARAAGRRDFLIGGSADTPECARAALAAGADYVGVGPVFGSRSKSDAGPPIGTARIRAVAEAVGAPVVAIGGIDAENAGPVFAAGAHGVAVIAAVMKAADPRSAAARLLACAREAGRSA